jgi:hypothetical protein
VRAAPVSSFTDLLLSVLERGFVLAVRLDGPPGDRRLLLGIGLADAADPLLMALCASGAFGHRSMPEYEDDFDWE